MKTVRVLLLATVLTVFGSVGQAEDTAPFLTKQQVQEMYSEIFTLQRETYEIDGEVVDLLSCKVASLPEDHVLGELLRENRRLIDYLWSENGVTEAERRKAIKSPSFPESYLTLLRQDEAFNSAFLEVAHRYLVGKGGGLTDYSAAPERSVSEDAVLKTAVRFVFPDKITVDGEIWAHICTAFSGLEDFAHRDLFVESLAYSAIRAAMDNEESGMQTAIQRVLKLAGKLDLSSNPEVAIQRAQGVAWGALLEAPELSHALKAEYLRVGNLLPIEIETWR